ncbi:XRE family transcriptional regulator, partial [Roseibium sp. AS2]|uniref:XRE family transcriptional regulator n=1 Tax=Roseibium sp. AS2 TaxID=3135781 RepID=UPI00317BAD11
EIARAHHGLLASNLGKKASTNLGAIQAKELTQVQLAKTLGIRQATVAQMEKRSDLMLSTLRSYVEAMGGKLKLSVEFPNHEALVLTGLGDTEDLKAAKEA